MRLVVANTHCPPPAPCRGELGSTPVGAGTRSHIPRSRTSADRACMPSGDRAMAGPVEPWLILAQGNLGKNRGESWR